MPDFGEARFNPRSGATVIGAREFLIAYNVNLNTKDRKLAHDIALDLREQGRAKRDSDGKIIRDDEGKAVKVPGLLKECKAVGWVIDEYQKAQVSINLTDYEVTPPHDAFEAVREAARKRGLRVTGSEIVGLIPLEALLLSGRYYLKQQNKTPAVPEKELIRVAVESMGLNDVAEFIPEEKIVDYQVKDEHGLISMSVSGFVDELSADSPAPGGGSVSALLGSLAGALVSMVASLTHGKKGMESVLPDMEEVGMRAQEVKDQLAFLVDADTKAFNRIIDANRMRKKSDEEKTLRQEAIQAATKDATEVPLNAATLCVEVLELTERVAREGNPNSVSDAGVAAEAALDVIETEPQRRARLWDNCDYFRGCCSQLRLDCGLSESYIVPVILGCPEKTMAVAAELFGQGFIVGAIRPPTVAPGSSRLRVSLMSEHSRDDIDGLVAALKAALCQK